MKKKKTRFFDILPPKSGVEHHRVEKMRFNFQRLFVPLAPGSNITYIHLTGVKVADRKMHTFNFSKQLNERAFYLDDGFKKFLPPGKVNSN